MFKKISVFFYFLSIVFIVTGFIVMFTYGDYDPDRLFDEGSTFGHIVGGDAYNYIIIGVRGLGFIITGLITTVIASTSLIILSINRNIEQYKNINSNVQFYENKNIL